MPVLKKYIDELPIPEVIKPKGEFKGQPYYEISIREFYQKLHRDLPATKVWGYEGKYPGPSFEVQRCESIYVKWINELPVDKHLLPVDTTIHGATPENPSVRTVVHLHGGDNPMESDGHPEAWFTNNFKEVGPFFTNKVYCYPNKQEAATLWYHDHTLGITRLNVYAGLSGFYIIHDENEKNLKLPRGKYDIPIVIQDRSFKDDGSLFYPAEPSPPIPGVYPSIVPEFFGDTILVNGKVWPYLEVEPRKYRFRILNGSNSRFYTMKLSCCEGISSPPWFQIATEQGLLEQPVQLSELTLGPGERGEVIMDFSDFKGMEILMNNSAPVPFPNGDPVEQETTGHIMKFIVKQSLTGEKDIDIQSRMNCITWLNPKKARKIRDFTLIEDMDDYGRLHLLLEGMQWDDPITTKSLLDTTEVWNLINLTIDTHPVHIHLVRFQIIERQPFDVERFMAEGVIKFTDNPIPPFPNERGWKDTVQANPCEITRIIAHFGSFQGTYPWHCHILEHEDHEMMRPFSVIRRSAK